MSTVTSMWVTGKDDVQHGKGIYYFHSGDRYEGDYVNGERTGQGIYIHKNGDKYVGQFKNGEQHGTGTFTWANGAVYEGQWVNNQRSGKGTLISGRTAMTMKVNGKTTWPTVKALCARLTEPNTRGIFVKGKEDGKGVLEDKNGVRYDGFFKQGKKHGAFVETDKNGNVIRKGVYKFGTLDAEQK